MSLHSTWNLWQYLWHLHKQYNIIPSKTYRHIHSCIPIHNYVNVLTAIRSCVCVCVCLEDKTGIPAISALPFPTGPHRERETFKHRRAWKVRMWNRIEKTKHPQGKEVKNSEIEMTKSSHSKYLHRREAEKTPEREFRESEGKWGGVRKKWEFLRWRGNK